MAKKRIPPWQFPAIVSGILIALGALGTFIVRSADYIKLPDLLAAESKRNDSQDQRLDKLITLQEFEQQHSNQQSPSRESPQGLHEYDDQGVCWECSYLDRQRCFDQNLWRKCE